MVPRYCFVCSAASGGWKRSASSTETVRDCTILERPLGVLEVHVLHLQRTSHGIGMAWKLSESTAASQLERRVLQQGPVVLPLEQSMPGEAVNRHFPSCFQ